MALTPTKEALPPATPCPQCAIYKTEHLAWNKWVAEEYTAAVAARAERDAARYERDVAQVGLATERGLRIAREAEVASLREETVRLRAADEQSGSAILSLSSVLTLGQELEYMHHWVVR